MSSRRPKVGIIADTTLLRHLVSSTVKSHGYDVGINLDPGKLNLDQEQGVDAWLVELEHEDKWSNFVDHLIDTTDAPILFGDGNAPAMSSDKFPRWQRRIFSKLKEMVGAPVPIEEQSESIALLEQAEEEIKVNPIALPTGYLDTYTRTKAQQVWVLGASLGGPEAVKQFLDALPAELPIAFILAQHINPGFQDVLAHVLGRHNKFNFAVAADQHELMGGDVIVCPVEHEVSFNDSGNIVFEKAPWNGPYSPSIDQVIHNVASVYPGECGAILFSGMGNDGAIAAPQMKKRGGVIWAQTAETCANSSMPDSVRATECVTYNGSPEELARHLINSLQLSAESCDAELDKAMGPASSSDQEH